MKIKQSRTIRKTIVAAAMASVLGGTQLSIISPALASVAPGASHETATLQRPSFASLIKQVRPAVVSITTTGKANAANTGQPFQFSMPNLPEGSPFNEFFERFFENAPQSKHGSQPKVKGAGSGFIISADGYVVTNHHVIDSADTIEITTDSGKQYKASVVGVDEKTDLALLKLDADTPLPFVEMGNSDIAEVGDWVIAVGNQFGLGGTATAGIISARGRDIQSGPFDDFLQIDAPINRGNSGGPLFDGTGKVIGINTAIYSPSGGNVGIGFAIPSNMASEIITELRSNGQVSRGWLGVQIQPVTEEIAESLGLDKASGVLVASVVEDGPASRAGIRAGDVITSMDGKPLDEFKALPRRVAKTRSGSESVFQVQREGKLEAIQVVIGAMPDEKPRLAKAPVDAASDDAALGVQLASLTPENRQRYSIAKDSTGVLVADVRTGSPASKAGIRPGYVISMVGQRNVATPDEVVESVKQASARKSAAVLLRVEYKGEKRFLAVKLAKA